MRAKATVRYALFLVLLVLGQEFTSARYLHAPLGNGSARLKRDAKESDIIDDEYGLVRYDARAERKRRGIVGVILLGTALGLSLTELGFELYFKLKGCCDDFGNNKLCEYAETYKTQKALLEQNNKAIDAKVLEAKHLLTDVELGNGQFQTVVQKVDHIMQQQEDLLTAIRPEVIKDFQTKMSQITAAARQKNTTVSAYTIDELLLSYQSVFDTLQGTMWAMGGIFASVLQGGIAVAYNQFRVNKVTKQLADYGNPSSQNYKLLANARHTKAAKIMGVDRVGVNKFIDSARQNKIEAKLKGTDGSAGKYAKGLKYTGWVISGVIVLASAALTTYSIIQKFKQCDNLEASAKKASENITLANVQLGKLKTNVTNYVVELDQVGATYIKSQLRDADFLKTLGDIQTLLEKASSQSTNNRDASALIKEYVTKIGIATLAESYDLVSKLTKGLSQVEYLYKCFTNKVELQNYVVRECKSGAKDLNEIWSDGSQSWSTEEKVCLSQAGIPYYSYADAQDGISKTSILDGFNKDCKLNNDNYKREACRLVKTDLMTPQQASTKMNSTLTPAQVTAITQNCPAPPMTPREKIQLCSFRAMKWTDENIHKMLLSHCDLAEIKAYKCP